MSIFGSIWHKITGTEAEPAAITEPVAKTEPATTTPAEPTPAATPTVTETAATPATDSPKPTETSLLLMVDVEQILSSKAAQKGEPNNWRTSIVDLLKLLDIDSSLTARKELAEELNVHEGDHGSVEQNIGLHRAVMLKLEENGGKVPDSLKSPPI